MQVYLVFDIIPTPHEVVGVFSTEQKAREWLDRAHDDFGWTLGEVAGAIIEPWTVDADIYQ